MVDLTGSKNSNWKGGKSKCPVCDKLLARRESKYCNKHWERNSNSYIGRIMTKETRDKISKTISGKNHYNWKIDRTKLKRYNDDTKDRRCYAYVNWRKQVWERDNFKCKISNSDCIGKIQAHHILSWKEYPELRYNLNNGITLCHAHHPRKRVKEVQLISIFKELIYARKV